MTSGSRYRDHRRRVLIDMHIGDWDPRFLSRYDPAAVVRSVRDANADAAMIYFQSHIGLCYWPTASGVRHGCCGDHDLAGETLAALNAADIPVCAYYSIGFNNRAWIDHPDWRIEPVTAPSIGVLPRERYGIVCLNNPDYRAFVDVQIAEILDYPVDAIFFDMVWWNGVCRCASCRDRYAREAQAEIPDIVDWSAPAWTQFQAARERWLSDFTIALRARAISIRPDVDVYQNFALALSNWTRGMNFASVAGHDFLGGDYYGGRAEQMFVTRLMLNLTPNPPAEFMTTLTSSLIEHSRLRSRAELRTKVFAALTADAAFLAILAIDPDGTIDAEAVARLADAYAAVAPYESCVGGDPVEEIGIYFSDASRMNLADSGQRLADAPAASIPDYPHFAAVTGVARILQQAHVPFGVLTRANLATLTRWPVIVLANIQRMAPDEVALVREYVAQGGRIYASRATSRSGMAGPPGDFALADVFGCHFAAEATGRLVYLRSDSLPELVRPLAHWRSPAGLTGSVEISADDGEDSNILARRTLPYGDPAPGTALDQRWASIHSSPPWEDRDDPMILRHNFGQGVAIYSAADIETGNSADHDALLLSLLRSLLPHAPRVEVDTHPCVWMSAFIAPGGTRMTMRLLNYPAEQPALPVPSAQVRIALAAGQRCTGVYCALRMTPIAFIDNGDSVEFEGGPITDFTMFLIDLVH